MSRQNRVYRFVVDLLAIIGVLSLLVVYTPLANLLARPLYAIPSNPRQADVIVVLSGGRYDDGPLNDAALERTVTAVRLYRQGLAPRLLFTGGPCCGQSTSSLMANLAVELGVPRSAILLEEQSLRTRDSATYSAAILRTHRMRTAILVTSPLHLLRAKLTFESSGVPVFTVRETERNLLLLSSAEERIAIFRSAIHEYLGLAFYRLRGWI